MNSADSSTVLSLSVVCDSTPSGASEVYAAMFSRESLPELTNSNGEYTATVDRIDVDTGRVWVTASFLGSGIDASGGWGGEDGTSIVREGGEWRFCIGWARPFFRRGSPRTVARMSAPQSATKGKWTEESVPDQTGRVAIITGSNTGLGYDTARVLAARGAKVVMAVRDTEKGQSAAARIVGLVPRADVSVQPLDLGSLQSVRTSAEEMKAAYPRIDLLINNAGVMYPPKQTTKDGFELQFGTNHLGHFALTGLLLDNLTGVEGSRIVTVSSVGHKIRAAIHFDDLQWDRSYDRVAAYGQAKLANLMFAYALQRKLAGAGKPTVSIAAHPGLSDTELTRHLPSILAPAANVLWPMVAQKPAMGALPTLRAATDPEARGGQYYGPSGIGETRGYPKVVGSSRQSKDIGIQDRLWTVSEELTGVKYPF